MVMWYEDNCPKCKKSNWVYNGDPQDMTVMDVDGIRCWNCNYAWNFEGEEIDPETAELGANMVEVKL